MQSSALKGGRFHIFEIARDMSMTTLGCGVFKSFFTPSSKTPPYWLNETRFLSNATPNPLYKWPLSVSQKNKSNTSAALHQSPNPKKWQKLWKVKEGKRQRQRMFIILTVASAAQRREKVSSSLNHSAFCQKQCKIVKCGWSVCVIKGVVEPFDEKPSPSFSISAQTIGKGRSQTWLQSGPL